MALDGEGFEMIIAFLVVLLAIVVWIVGWNVLKKKKSLYTYKYSRK